MPIDIQSLELPGVLLIRPRKFSDARGSFYESFRRDAYEEAGVIADFVQDNAAHSHHAGTIRGLHFQAPPSAQAKLIHVLRGAIFDVAVDIRRGSSTYGRWCGAKLTAEGLEQLFVPHGFAHGYCTLEDDVTVAYKVDGYYAPGLEGGIRWDDEKIGIPWPVGPDRAIVSDKDKVLPALAGLESPFH